MTVVLGAGGVVVFLLLGIALMVSRNYEKRSQKLLALVALGLAPMAFLAVASFSILENSKNLEFCGSCHTMDVYVKSLESQDGESLAASHYLNGRVPRDKPCYECHAYHTPPIVGSIKTKLKGLHEARVEFLGDPESPIVAKREFTNDNCLHCHKGTTKFEETHEDDRDALISGETVCLECHDVGHVIEGGADDE